MGHGEIAEYNDLAFWGKVAEWLCSGLQSRERRFDSDPCLHFEPGWRNW